MEEKSATIEVTIETEDGMEVKDIPFKVRLDMAKHLSDLAVSLLEED